MGGAGAHFMSTTYPPSRCNAGAQTGPGVGSGVSCWWGFGAA